MGKVKRLEKALGFKLTQWQKEFIFCGKRYGSDVKNIRANGKTTAHCLWACFSKGETLYAVLRNPEIEFYMGADIANIHRQRYFISELRKIYIKLKQAKIKGLRDIKFKGDSHYKRCDWRDLCR